VRPTRLTVAGTVTGLVTGLVTLPALLGVLPAAGAGAGAGAVVAETLTPGPERYVVRSGPAGRLTVRATAPADGLTHDWNRREVVLAPGVTDSRDQSVCATWTAESNRLDQQGLAVRLRTGPAGRSRAITLTKNTYAGYVWVFNLLSWDTRRSGVPWLAIAQFDLSPVVTRHHRLLPFPWRVCLRAVDRRVDFKVWLPARESEPAWSDPVHVRSARVAARLTRPGVPGWYVGHLRPGDRVTYADTAADDLTPRAGNSALAFAP
jgi:hypothetical protein